MEIAHYLFQHKLSDSILCQCCNFELETDTCHILYCSCNRLGGYRESFLSAFTSNYNRFKGNDKTIKLLLQVMLEEDDITLLCRLWGLYLKLYKIGIRNLWHGFFPKSLLTFLYLDLLCTLQLIVKLIKLSLLILYQLWIKCCNLIY